MKRGTLWATVGRQKRAAYTGDPAEPNHAVFVQAAQIEVINECRRTGSALPTFVYTVAELPDPVPAVQEVVQAIPGAAKSTPGNKPPQPAEVPATIPEVN